MQSTHGTKPVQWLPASPVLWVAIFIIHLLKSAVAGMTRLQDRQGIGRAAFAAVRRKNLQWFRPAADQNSGPIIV
jgi:hypothetical protein